MVETSQRAHVMDIETNTQVAEYKGQLSPKEFGHFLVGLAALNIIMLYW
jgi:hypothetical protein